MEGIKEVVTEAQRLAGRRERAVRNLEANPFIDIITRLKNDTHFILRVRSPAWPGVSTVDFYPDSLEWVKRKSLAKGMGVGRLFCFFKIRYYPTRRGR